MPFQDTTQILTEKLHTQLPAQVTFLTTIPETELRRERAREGGVRGRIMRIISGSVGLHKLAPSLLQMASSK